ncbi:YceI family protein [Cytophagaceae bacterium YF14B1]|uniref:YceI family protein n=1 Tax=Xanthocytophaga flava TaxID=3048013 RepID=A0AAE3U4M3_9BACT|nr:YceI family protein [Xanthocytophaga flavus]MDJ1479864.1 YceI family protein [Xanthocytophaga flavus]
METKYFNIVSEKSKIEWIGRKVTGTHNGTITIKEGTLVFTEDRFKSGQVIVDTTSITILDVTDPATNDQFAGHLASDDFFSSEKYPEAVLEITDAIPESDNDYHLNGNLTIKGITHPISFYATVYVIGQVLTASGKITIDRTKYGMRFRSGNFFKDLGDTLIYNNFDLDVYITATTINKTVLA